MDHEKENEEMRICIEDLAAALCNGDRYDVAQSIFRRYDAHSTSDLSCVYYDVVYADMKDAVKELL